MMRKPVLLKRHCPLPGVRIPRILWGAARPLRLFAWGQSRVCWRLIHWRLWSCFIQSYPISLKYGNNKKLSLNPNLPTSHRFFSNINGYQDIMFKSNMFFQRPIQILAVLTSPPGEAPGHRVSACQRRSGLSSRCQWRLELVAERVLSRIVNCFCIYIHII